MLEKRSRRGGARPGSGRKKKSADGTLSHATFTAEQLKSFVDSPHVAYVSSKTVTYTKAFKIAAWDSYCNGENPIQIFADAGLDIKTLGRYRIESFFKTLREAKEKGLAFTEGNEPYPNAEKKYDIPPPPKRPKLRKVPLLSDTEISKLVTKVAFMSQELEFIKKLFWQGRRKNSYVHGWLS